MKQITYSVLLALFLMVACTSPSTSQVQQISNQDLVKLMENKDLQLIDVRTPEEVADGFIKGAINIDFRGADFESKIGAMDRNKPIAVYCGAGIRSGGASELLLELGFQDIYDLSEGFSQWKEDSQPIEMTK
jgi:rhodanese-related sulfurtransferase